MVVVVEEVLKCEKPCNKYKKQVCGWTVLYVCSAKCQLVSAQLSSQKYSSSAAEYTVKMLSHIFLLLHNRTSIK